MTSPSAPTVAGSTPSVALGRAGLRQLHASLLAHAPDQAITILQEAGYAAGPDLYATFSAWLPGRAGVDRPEDIDAAAFADVLSEFFTAHGWGPVAAAPIGRALALDSTDWAEADPGTAQIPMCFLSAGMLADFIGRVSGETVAAMEVECRSKGDERCRFLTAHPDVLQQVYEQMTQGKGYEEALA